MGDSPIQWRKRDQERGINMQNTLHVEHLEKFRQITKNEKPLFFIYQKLTDKYYPSFVI